MPYLSCYSFRLNPKMIILNENCCLSLPVLHLTALLSLVFIGTLSRMIWLCVVMLYQTLFRRCFSCRRYWGLLYRCCETCTISLRNFFDHKLDWHVCSVCYWTMIFESCHSMNLLQYSISFVWPGVSLCLDYLQVPVDIFLSLFGHMPL